MTSRCKSYWLPGLGNDDVDSDEVIHSAFAWLRTEQCSGKRLVVMNALGMTKNRPSLAQASAPYIVISPRARQRIGAARRTGNAVLAIWPTHETLELAERLARDGSLCVIPGSLDDVSHWIQRTSAHALWDVAPPNDDPLRLDEPVRRVIDSIIAFDGRNNFLGAGGKEQAIRRLRSMIGDGHRPDPSALENYMLARGRREFQGRTPLARVVRGTTSRPPVLRLHSPTDLGAIHAPPPSAIAGGGSCGHRRGCLALPQRLVRRQSAGLRVVWRGGDGRPRGRTGRFLGCSEYASDQPCTNTRNLPVRR